MFSVEDATGTSPASSTRQGPPARRQPARIHSTDD